jgi:hypothetical protein
VFAFVWKDLRSPGQKEMILLIVFLAGLLGGTRLKHGFVRKDLLTPPDGYLWLEKRKEDVVFEYPAYLPSDKEGSKIEVYRMYWSLYHHKNLINGYSGFFPPEREVFVKKMNDLFPSDQAALMLKKLKVDLVIVRKVGLSEEKVDLIRSKFDHSFYEDEKSLIVKI